MGLEKNEKKANSHNQIHSKTMNKGKTLCLIWIYIQIMTNFYWCLQTSIFTKLNKISKTNRVLHLPAFTIPLNPMHTKATVDHPRSTNNPLTHTLWATTNTTTWAHASVSKEANFYKQIEWKFSHKESKNKWWSRKDMKRTRRGGNSWKKRKKNT